MPAFLSRFSMGIGDRFGREGEAQLRAFQTAAAQGVPITPVWNKSFREHTIVGTQPAATRAAADAAVAAAGWNHPYFVDADHIQLKTVEGFLAACDFYTIDVASAIGKYTDIEDFVRRHGEASRPAALKYLFAVQEASRIYRRIERARGPGNFITEVSMDETDVPQTPEDLRVILAAIAEEKIPVQTLAPKFTGRFNKGVDYAGDLEGFEREFRADLAVVEASMTQYDLPKDLKLSIHSGSDKFSLYPIMAKAIKDFGAGLHLKTAGTTWLEELIGLAEAGGEGLKIAQDIYSQSYARREELCAPYADVVDIDASRLPSPATVNSWSPQDFVAALRHDQTCPQFNLHLRQLLHVGFRVAAEMGARYFEALASCRDAVARNVATNLYDRHIVPLFLGAAQ